MSTRESYVEHFGEEEAIALETAGNGHRGEILEGNEHGPDPFRDAVVIAIGFQCFELDSYRKWHGINTSYEDIKKWIKEFGDIGNHIGPKDYLAFMAGAYNEYVGIEEENI